MKTVPSNDEVQEISDFFKEYVFGFIYHDIDAAIDGKANFLVALALTTYTEFLGGLINGNFGIDAQGKMIPGQCGKNFETFFGCLGTPYQNLVNELNVYGVIRSGLVHQYFVKREGTIWMGLPPEIDCGIKVNSDGKIHFYVQKYFADLKEAVRKYYNKLVIERDPDLITAFFKARNTYLSYIP